MLPEAEGKHQKKLNQCLDTIKTPIMKEVLEENGVVEATFVSLSIAGLVSLRKIDVDCREDDSFG